MRSQAFSFCTPGKSSNEEWMVTFNWVALHYSGFSTEKQVYETGDGPKLFELIKCGQATVFLSLKLYLRVCVYKDWVLSFILTNLLKQRELLLTGDLLTLLCCHFKYVNKRIQDFETQVMSQALRTKGVQIKTREWRQCSEVVEIGPWWGQTYLPALELRT